MEQSEPKSFLYAWLGKNKLGQPVYSVQPDFRGGRSRFKCELRVAGFEHCGLGKCTNKKDAERFAAIDFIQHLLNVGRLKPADVPASVLSSRENEAGGTANGAVPAGTAPTNAWTRIEGRMGGHSAGPGNFPAGPHNAPSADFRRFDPAAHAQAQAQLVQEQEEGYRTESSELHGNWTLETAKSRLHQFLQTTRQFKVDYEYHCVGLDHSRTWSAQLNVYAPKCRKWVRADARASNKQVASKQCALSIVQQLFHLGEIEAYTGPVARVHSSDPLPPYPITLHPQVERLLDESLSALGDDWASHSHSHSHQSRPEAGDSNELLLLSARPSQNNDAGVDNDSIRCVSWSPVSANWNCWSGGNLEEGDSEWSGMSLASINQRLYEEWQSHNKALRGQNLRDANGSVQAQAAAAAERRALPVFHKLPEIVDVVERNRVVLIRGETGCGKTTQIAQYIVDKAIASGRGAHCNVVVTQPRRISAISVAERVATERGESLAALSLKTGVGPASGIGGGSVGYAVRFESVFPRPFGAILYCTVGVLLRKMADGLRGISHVLVDEIHERDVNTDFLLIVLREMVNRYPDLRVVLMSATIDTELLSAYFNHPPVIEIPGRVHPVNEYYLEDCIEMTQFTAIPSPEGPVPTRGANRKRKKREDQQNSANGAEDDDDDEEDAAAEDGEEENCNEIIDETVYSPATKASMSALSEKDFSFELVAAILWHVKKQGEDGAVLVFLPGWNLISALGKYLSSVGFDEPNRFRLYALHSQLPKDEQRRVFEPVPAGITKVILSTNIAESSITINDVVCVIDSCKSKIKLFTSYNNMTHYATVWASRASLDQRKGRAGRVRPGTCYRLCSRARYSRLEQHASAEMLRASLDSLVLAIKLLQLGSARGVLSRAIEPPTVDHVVDAVHFLRELGALDDGEELTPLGRLLAKLPVEPRIAKMLVCSCFFNLGDAAALLAAAIELPEPFESLGGGQRAISSAKSFDSSFRRSDHFALLNAFSRWFSFSRVNEQSEINFCTQRMLNRSTLKTLRDAKIQLIDILQSSGFPEECFQPLFYDFNGRPDANLDTLSALLTLGLYPNVCYRKPRQRRAVITMEGRCALIQKTSVLCERPDATSYGRRKFERLDTPFLVFAEKLRTKTVTCKSLSSITGLEALLFGCRKAVWKTDTNRLVLDTDTWISLELRSVDMAAKLLALRRQFELLVEKVAEDPVSLTSLSEPELQLLSTISLLSKSHIERGEPANESSSFTDRFFDAPNRPGPSAPNFPASNFAAAFGPLDVPAGVMSETDVDSVAAFNEDQSEVGSVDSRNVSPSKRPRLADDDANSDALYSTVSSERSSAGVPPGWIRDASMGPPRGSWGGRGRGFGRGEALQQELDWASRETQPGSFGARFPTAANERRFARPQTQSYYGDLLGSPPSRNPFTHQQNSVPRTSGFPSARGGYRGGSAYDANPNAFPAQPYRFAPFSNRAPRPSFDWRGSSGRGGMSRW